MTARAARDSAIVLAMKLSGVIAVQVAGAAVLREPRLWDKIKRAFGGEPDLRTGAMRAALEAGAVVDAVRAALTSLGATNAVALVVDDLVLFDDRHGRPDDLGDLFLAFHDHAAAIDGAFGLLRLAVEHVEAGLHLVIEVQARGEHPADEPAVRVVIGGRVQAFEPRRDESAEAYRARIAPLANDPTTLTVARVQFDSFVARVRDAVAAAMPAATATVARAELQVRRPGQTPTMTPPPTAPTYDPYWAFYPSPLWMVTDVLLWTALWSMAMPPDVVVVNYTGDAIGSLDSPGFGEHMPDVDGAGGLAEAASDAPDLADGGDAGDAGGDAGDAGGGFFEDGLDLFD